MNIEQASKMLGMRGKEFRSDLWLLHIAVMQEKVGKVRVVDKYLNLHHGEIGPKFIPLSFFRKHAGQHFSPSMLSLAYGWAFGGVELNFDLWMFEQLCESDPVDEAPMSWLDMLPGWTVHFPISNHAITETKPEISGWFLARRSGDENDVLLFASPTPEGQTAVHELDIVPTTDGFFRLNDSEGKPLDGKFFQIVLAFLFFCTLIPHTSAVPRITKQTRKGGVFDYHLQLRDKPCVIPLQAEQKQYVESHDGYAGARQSERKAHLRRAHWRSVWLGPRDGEQHKELRWIPPTFVRGFKAE